MDKVTSATELAATEVMDIVDNVTNRLNNMKANLDDLQEKSDKEIDLTYIKEKVATIRDEIDGSQYDLFSIMNALQFQDITTQQINSFASTFDTVHQKLAELLKGFEDESINVFDARKVAFDPNAEFDFSRSSKSQTMADEIIFGEDGQPDISSIIDQINSKDDNSS